LSLKAALHCSSSLLIKVCVAKGAALLNPERAPDARFMTYSTASEHLNAGKLRALATTSRTRVQPLPEVPAIAEAGYKDAEMDDWWVGISAPARTPKDQLSQLADWIRSALESPELKAKLAALGFYSVGICGTDFARLLRKQYDEFGRVIREANVKAE
jgi:tripartite-type tricarboxylate transporter receptor subunit TctC